MKLSTFTVKIGINVATRVEFCRLCRQQNPTLQHGDYSITVSAPVCGTGSSGSIPGSRPSANQNTPFWECFDLVTADTASKLLCSRQESNAGAV
tara:strand:- start:9460 stop:9741 length:282 start_codon:yes stop_codon:yes gene_type:complete